MYGLRDFLCVIMIKVFRHEKSQGSSRDQLIRKTSLHSPLTTTCRTRKPREDISLANVPDVHRFPCGVVGDAPVLEEPFQP